jgi:hypothetical protein
MALGDAYRVEPNPQLMVDAEIVYRGMPAGADDITVGAVRRAAFDAKMGRWIPLPRIEVDPAHDLVAAIDGEISLFYGLIGQDGTASTTGTSSDSNDTPGTDTGTDPTAGGEDTEIGEVFFAGDIQPLFDEHCVTDCHEPGGMELANVMLDGNAYDRIVDQFPATATKPYIKPGEPENSYLMHKLDGTHTLDESFGGCGCSGAGATMPLNQLQLDQHTRNVVRAWIDQGAPP